jgi:triacylglycerol esterase/lipase EstA (alpha/beta hydrolase family)
MNNWSCQPSAAHPYPVILLHGTWLNETITWQALSPMLVNAGYCVFGLNYGAAAGTDGRVYAIGDIAASATQLASFVGEVLESTHASQVDIVGHSQGGMMPRYFMKFLGGAPLVHMLVGLAPSNHGTTLSALVMEETSVDLGLSATGCSACTEQRVGSAFLSTLNTGGDTVPGPAYVVIETSHDTVVTPYESAFMSGPDVENILLQTQCPNDTASHLSIPYDAVALQDVINALGPDSQSFQPRCG